jgi:cytochrome c oxidase subunit 2
MRPSFGEPQTAIAIVFAVIALLLAVTFAIIARQTRGEVPLEQVRSSAYAIRRFWFAFLVLLLGAAVGVSLFFLPYSSDAKPTTTVQVTGGQFYWSMSPEKLRAGTTVDFDVTSADVNHGLGVYDPDGHLIGSVQAMPGFHNHLELTLDDPGTYLVSCLEMCGIDHHKMSREFEVIER